LNLNLFTTNIEINNLIDSTINEIGTTKWRNSRLFISTQLESRKIFEEYIEENQVDYKVRIEKAGKSSFKPIGSAY
jgi:hypothetical protein